MSEKNPDSVPLADAIQALGRQSDELQRKKEAAVAAERLKFELFCNEVEGMLEAEVKRAFMRGAMEGLAQAIRLVPPEARAVLRNAEALFRQMNAEDLK